MTFLDAIHHYGSQAEAARRLGVTRAAVNQWQSLGIPYLRQCQIQVETRGALLADAPEASASREAA